MQVFNKKIALFFTWKSSITYDIKNIKKLDDSGILSRLNSARKQGVKNVVLFIPDTMEESFIKLGINRFANSEFKTQPMKIIYIYKGKITTLDV